MTPEDLLRRWLKRVRESSFAHYAAESSLNRLHLFLGIPATAFAALVGTSVFASLENNISSWIKIAVGLISIVTAILSGLQTFLRFAEKAERHRKTAVEYGVVRRSIEQHLVYANQLTYEVSDRIRERLDKIAAEAPNVAPRLWSLAEKRAGDDYFLAGPPAPGLESAPAPLPLATSQATFPTDDLH